MGNTITMAMILSHIDVINCLHYPIADNPENRKKFDEYICSICCKISCLPEKGDVELPQKHLLSLIC